MTDIIKDILLIWGSVLSTCLILFQFFKYFRNKPKISVELSFINRTTDEETEVKGTKVINERGHFMEVLLHVVVKNHGQKAVQISAIFVKTNTNEKPYEKRIIPDGFPVVINPLCSVEAEIQKEWIDDEKVVGFGIIDGLGNYCNVNKEKLISIVEQSNKMPSNKKQYVNKTNPDDIVFAFQSKDKFTLINKKK